VLAAWQGGDDLDADAAGLLGDLPAGAREHWHVEAEVVRAACTHPWRGWMPDDAHARALDLAEPAVILISGELYARHVAAFLHDSAGAVAHALPHPGYLGGLAIASSPLNTTSCSCWRTYREARDYAYKPGGHRDALRRDRARRHHRTEHFLRLRPLRERGTLDGAAPLADVLAGGLTNRSHTAAPSSGGCANNPAFRHGLGDDAAAVDHPAARRLLAQRFALALRVHDDEVGA
jgi:hypothetical protein